jgi:type IV pilus assembly protein PilB
MAESYGIPYADLNSNPPSNEQIKLIPAAIAQKYRAVLYDKLKNGTLVIATDKPSKQVAAGLKSALKKRSIKLAYGLTEDIDRLFLVYRAPLNERLKEAMAMTGRSAPKVLDEIVDEALVRRASDIHLEPGEGSATVRLRIDGRLKRVASLDLETYRGVTNRLKVLARMRIDEHRAPQDGAIRWEKGSGKVDMRLSMIPVFDEEKAVMRILSSYTRGFALSNLGLGSAVQEKISDVSERPFGMLIVAGPTGSGKTTTMYGLIKTVNSEEVNISTIEDPVEYRIPWVNHIQTNSEAGLTFATGLRSIVRQDPDVIFVGEIRDVETAEIAVNAALTGHLLLSTFHANNAATVIPRLIDMGVEPFLLSSTIEGVLAQRLVRKLCDRCRVSKTVKISEIKKTHPEAVPFLPTKSCTVYEAQGCTACAGSGYAGRTGIFEFIRFSNALKSLILKRPSMQEIWELAQKEGAGSMFQDGIQKVLEGVTTFEEVMRVAPPAETYGQEQKSTKKA